MLSLDVMPAELERPKSETVGHVQASREYSPSPKGAGLNTDNNTYCTKFVKSQRSPGSDIGGGSHPETLDTLQPSLCNLYL